MIRARRLALLPRLRCAVRHQGSFTSGADAVEKATLKFMREVEGRRSLMFGLVETSWTQFDYAPELPRLEKDFLTEEWWRLETRRQRLPGLMGRLSSLFLQQLAWISGWNKDGRFKEGARDALERVHEVMGSGDDGDSLYEFCDAGLADKLNAALDEVKSKGADVVRACEIKPEGPTVTHWRVSIGVERAATEDKQEYAALDLRAIAGVLVVLPKIDFEPFKIALEQSKTAPERMWRLGNLIENAMENKSVALQCVVSFTGVRESLFVSKKNPDKSQLHQSDEASPSEEASSGETSTTDAATVSAEVITATADDIAVDADPPITAPPKEPTSEEALWLGSSPGWVICRRQAVFEAVSFRDGVALKSTEWMLVDIDDIMHGGAEYWGKTYKPVYQ